MGKNLLELYKELLTQFEKKEEAFICGVIHSKLFSEEEQDLLQLHFYTQFPSKTQYKKFYDNEFFNKDTTFGVVGSWFSYHRADALNKTYLPESEPFKLRVDLLKAIIENLEREYIIENRTSFKFKLNHFIIKTFNKLKK